MTILKEENVIIDLPLHISGYNLTYSSNSNLEIDNKILSYSNYSYNETINFINFAVSLNNYEGWNISEPIFGIDNTNTLYWSYFTNNRTPIFNSINSFQFEKNSQVKCFSMLITNNGSIYIDCSSNQNDMIYYIPSLTNINVSAISLPLSNGIPENRSLSYFENLYNSSAFLYRANFETNNLDIFQILSDPTVLDLIYSVNQTSSNISNLKIDAYQIFLGDIFFTQQDGFIYKISNYWESNVDYTEFYIKDNLTALTVKIDSYNFLSEKILVVSGIKNIYLVNWGKEEFYIEEVYENPSYGLTTNPAVQKLALSQFFLYSYNNLTELVVFYRGYTNASIIYFDTFTNIIQGICFMNWKYDMILILNQSGSSIMEFSRSILRISENSLSNEFLCNIEAFNSENSESESFFIDVIEREDLNLYLTTNKENLEYTAMANQNYLSIDIGQIFSGPAENFTSNCTGNYISNYKIHYSTQSSREYSEINRFTNGYIWLLQNETFHFEINECNISASEWNCQLLKSYALNESVSKFMNLTSHIIISYSSKPEVIYSYSLDFVLLNSSYLDCLDLFKSNLKRYLACLQTNRTILIDEKDIYLTMENSRIINNIDYAILDSNKAIIRENEYKDLIFIQCIQGVIIFDISLIEYQNADLVSNLNLSIYLTKENELSTIIGDNSLIAIITSSTFIIEYDISDLISPEFIKKYPKFLDFTILDVQQKSASYLSNSNHFAFPIYLPNLTLSVTVLSAKKIGNNFFIANFPQSSGFILSLGLLKFNEEYDLLYIDKQKDISFYAVPQDNIFRLDNLSGIGNPYDLDEELICSITATDKLNKNYTVDVKVNLIKQSIQLSSQISLDNPALYFLHTDPDNVQSNFSMDIYNFFNGTVNRIQPFLEDESDDENFEFISYVKPFQNFSLSVDEIIFDSTYVGSLKIFLTHHYIIILQSDILSFLPIFIPNLDPNNFYCLFTRNFDIINGLLTICQSKVTKKYYYLIVNGLENLQLNLLSYGMSDFTFIQDVKTNGNYVAFLGSSNKMDENNEVYIYYYNKIENDIKLLSMIDSLVFSIPDLELSSFDFYQTNMSINFILSDERKGLMFIDFDPIQSIFTNQAYIKMSEICILANQDLTNSIKLKHAKFIRIFEDESIMMLLLTENMMHLQVRVDRNFNISLYRLFLNKGTLSIALAYDINQEFFAITNIDIDEKTVLNIYKFADINENTKHHIVETVGPIEIIKILERNIKAKQFLIYTNPNGTANKIYIQTNKSLLSGYELYQNYSIIVKNSDIKSTYINFTAYNDISNATVMFFINQNIYDESASEIFAFFTLILIFLIIAYVYFTFKKRKSEINSYDRKFKSVIE